VQKISFGNKEYVKASAIAKRFRYTQDYVGQLCRNKKVDARLVGRTWYVEPDSVAAYRKTKHSTQKSTATKVALNTQSKRNPNPKSVAAVPRSKTLKSTQRPATSSSATPVTYSNDSEVSIPIVSKAEGTRSLKVTSDGGSNKKAPETEPTPTKKPTQKIKIKKSGSEKTNFKTEKMPEISLSGKLKVKETSNEIEQKEQAEIVAEARKSTQQASHIHSRSAVHTAAVAKPGHATASPTSKRHEKRTTGNFTPKQVQAAKPARSSILHSDWFLVASLVLGVCSALAILSLASLGQISSSTNNSWSLFFDFAQLKNLLF
jgi:hypothetical protein